MEYISESHELDYRCNKTFVKIFRYKLNFQIISLKYPEISYVALYLCLSSYIHKEFIAKTEVSNPIFGRFTMNLKIIEKNMIKKIGK